MDWSKLNVTRAPDKVTEPPPESFTVADYAVQFNVSISKARNDVSKMVRFGKLKKTIVLVGQCLIPHYTLVKSEVEADNGSGRRRGNRGRPHSA